MTDRYPSVLRPSISAKLSLTWGSVDKIQLDQELIWPPNNPFQGASFTLDSVILLLRPLGILPDQHALIGRRTCVVRAEVVDGDKKKYGGEIASSPEYFKSTQIDGKRIEYERRNLQVLVMTELLPIKDLTTADTLIPVIKGVFNGYKWLYKNAGVLHRDINEYNLMYWKSANGVFCGVLCDYDLSLQLAQQLQGPRSTQRTGTRPFMSLDLLESTPCKHLYRHDLESLFYVIIVLMFRSGGRFEKFPALEDWFTLGSVGLWEKKAAWYTSQIPHPAPKFERLYPLAIKMSRMFRDGYLARLDHANLISLGNLATPAFEEATLGGHVGFDTFQAILESV